MRIVFLDTVGLLALWDQRDQWHARAREAYTEISRSPIRFFTSEPVLLECANATSRTILRQNAVELRDRMLQIGSLLLAEDSLTEQAWNEFRGGKPGQPGVVDLISFALMRSYGISEVFTNDLHFKVAGFTTLF